MMVTPFKDGRWSRLYDCCQSCGLTDRYHAAKGLCVRCYTRTRQHAAYQASEEYRARISATRKRQYLKHHAKHSAYCAKYRATHREQVKANGRAWIERYRGIYGNHPQSWHRGVIVSTPMGSGIVMGNPYRLYGIWSVPVRMDSTGETIEYRTRDLKRVGRLSPDEMVAWCIIKGTQEKVCS